MLARGQLAGARTAGGHWRLRADDVMAYQTRRMLAELVSVAEPLAEPADVLRALRGRCPTCGGSR
jgi:hypothetical protein